MKISNISSCLYTGQCNRVSGSPVDSSSPRRCIPALPRNKLMPGNTIVSRLWDHRGVITRHRVLPLSRARTRNEKESGHPCLFPKFVASLCPSASSSAPTSPRRSIGQSSWLKIGVKGWKRSLWFIFAIQDQKPRQDGDPPTLGAL